MYVDVQILMHVLKPKCYVFFMGFVKANIYVYNFKWIRAIGLFECTFILHFTMNLYTKY